MPCISKCFQFSKCNIGIIGVLTSYFAVYLFIITKANGIPYVMDNNETFSTLNHAYNLWNFDFFQSFGLADEAASPFAAAHPVVHTHQGNFPRIFSFLLFSLGARSAEAQIWITTFTVGLASILMAYDFLKRRAGNLFATFATLMLMTDYLLFAQWQVNTYRVWHGFFLFACLLCVHGFSEWKRLYWALATIVLYASLFYWELVFASFVAVTVGAYTILIYHRVPRLIVTAGVTQAIGAVLGLGILIVQLILYLGWHDFLTDLKYTYTGRFHSDDLDASIEVMRNFYAMKNVLFIFNFQSQADFNGIAPFLHSIFANLLEVPTFFFAFITLSLAVAAMFADFRFQKASDAEIVNPQVTVAATVILIPSLFGFFFILAFDGVSLSSLLATGTTINKLSVLFIFVVAVSFSIGLRRLSAIISVSGTPPGFRRCAITSAYFLAFGAFAFVQGDQGLWFGLLAPITGWIAKLIAGISILIGSLLLLTGTRSILGQWQNVPTSLVPFFTCGALGYLFVYTFGAGYLHSGYLFPLFPLPVFHVDTLLALGPFSAFAISTNLLRGIKNMRSRLVVTSLTILPGSLCVLLVAYWAVLQYRYFTILPPDRFSFFQTLKSLAFPNEGIVSSAYAAPFSYIAKTWAYADGEFGKGENGLTPFAFRQRDSVWLRDAQSNKFYKRPGIFVCFENSPRFHGLINPAAPDFLNNARCSAMPVTFYMQQVPDYAGTPIGNLTDYGGLAASFDGNVAKVAKSCSAPPGGIAVPSPRGYANFIGKDWGYGITKKIIAFKVFPPTNQQMMQSAPINLKLQGSNDNVAWTDLYSGTDLAPGAPENLSVATEIDSSTAYRFHRVNIQGNGVNALVVCQVQFFVKNSDDAIKQLKQDAIKQLEQNIKGVQHAKLIMHDEKQGLWALYRLQWGPLK